MAALTIDVPDRISEALAPLDQGDQLAADAALKEVLPWDVNAVHETPWDLSEHADDPEPGELRRLARRLEVLASTRRDGEVVA